MAMTPYERMRAMVEGKAVDRPGVSVWKHFFLDDRYALDHAKKSASFQDMNDWDFIKIMTTNVHMEAAYGSKVKWSVEEGDRTRVFSRPVKSPRGLTELKAISVKDSPALMKEVEVAKRLVDKYHGKVPVMATCDLPGSYVKSLYCGFEDPSLYTELVRYYPQQLVEAEKVMTDVAIQFIEEYVKAGVDGIFLPTNVANVHYMTQEEYKEYILPYDVEVAKAAQGKTWFNMLHIHGDGEVFFDLVEQALPAQAVNWHTFTTNVSMAEAAKKTDKILVGGLDHMKDFFIADRDVLKERLQQRVKDASNAVEANRLIIAGGCSIVPPNVPDARLNVLREVIDETYGA